VKTDYHQHFSFHRRQPAAGALHHSCAPRRQSPVVKDYKSDSEISGVQGDLGFETYKGTARIEGIQGAFDLNTYKGDIRAIFARFAGPSRIDTYKGTVDISLPPLERLRNSRRPANVTPNSTAISRRTIHSTRRESKVQGAVNGGEPALRVKSYRAISGCAGFKNKVLYLQSPEMLPQVLNAQRRTFDPSQSRNVRRNVL